MSTKILLLAILLSFACICATSTKIVVSDSEKKYCGTRLREAMKVVCDREYFSKRKRNFNSPGGYNHDNGFGEDDRMFPYIAKYAANSLIPRRYRRYNEETGIVEECCRRPCTKDELLQYCKP